MVHGVDPDLVEELGWEFSGNPLMKVAEKPLIKLIQTCMQASDIVRGQTNRGESETALDGVSIRNRILDDLEPVINPWLADAERTNRDAITATTHYLLVRKADDYYDSIGQGMGCRTKEISP